MESTSSSTSSQSSEGDVVERGRGRGRGGRGRGRGRGTGRGKGKRVMEKNRADEALRIIQSRKNRLKNELQVMDPERMRSLLLGVLEQHPSLLLDLHEPPERFPEGYHPPEGSQAPSWCSCNNCREMPTQQEKLCCQNSPEYCTSQLPDFNVLILDEAVLALARMYRRDVLVIDDEADIRKANRHAAYRQFVLWQHGRLSQGDRRVIPSCCVWRIRDKYPDMFGQYTGFLPSRLV